MILLFLACAEPGPLLDPLAWESTTEDPWGGGPACDTWWWEDGIIELSTEVCAWPTVTQPLLRDLRAGEEFAGGVLWDVLYAEEPAEAVMGVAIGDEVVFEHVQPVPSGPGDAQMAWTPDERVPAGTQVFLHAHNHGLNTYDFVLP